MLGHVPVIRIARPQNVTLRTKKVKNTDFAHARARFYFDFGTQDFAYRKSHTLDDLHTQTDKNTELALARQYPAYVKVRIRPPPQVTRHKFKSW